MFVTAVCFLAFLSSKKPRKYKLILILPCPPRSVVPMVLGCVPSSVPHNLPISPSPSFPRFAISTNDPIVMVSFGNWIDCGVEWLAAVWWDTDLQYKFSNLEFLSLAGKCLFVFVWIGIPFYKHFSFIWKWTHKEGINYILR